MTIVYLPIGSADGHYVFLNHRSSEVKTDAYLTSLTGSSSGAMYVYPVLYIFILHIHVDI